MQLVEPLTKLQLLEDIKEKTGSDSSVAEHTDTITQSHILKSTHHIHIHTHAKEYKHTRT